MPRKCSVCVHEKRKEIDKAILNSVPYRDISRQYNVSKDSINRHVENGHIAEKIKKAKESDDIKQGRSMLEKIDDLDRIADDAISLAKEKKDPKSLCLAIKEKRENVLLHGKVSGEYTERKELTGANGGPIEILTLTDDELEKEILDVLSRVKETPE